MIHRGLGEERIYPLISIIHVQGLLHKMSHTSKTNMTECWTGYDRSPGNEDKVAWSSESKHCKLQLQEAAC